MTPRPPRTIPVPGVGRPGHPGRPARATRRPPSPAFTLIELLLAVAIFSVVLAAIQVVFHGALRLRNRTTETLADSVPIQRALGIVRRDLANLVLPGGTLFGQLQSVPTTGVSTNDSGSPSPGTTAITPASLRLGQVGPSFYSAVGTIDDARPWAEVAKVTYRLVEPTNNAEGLDLVRSVTRNLLAPLAEEAEDQFILQGLEQVTFTFYDGTQWLPEWDSTTAETVMPLAIRVELLLARSRTNDLYREPISLVVPVEVQADTSAATSSTSTDADAGAGTTGGQP